MKCEICNDRYASVVVYIIDKEEKLNKKLFLCDVCANKIPVSSLVYSKNHGILLKKKHFYPKEKSEGIPDKVCSFCLTTTSDFLENGTLGCSHCYDAFHELIQNSIPKKEPHLIHRGKFPVRLFRRKKIEKNYEQMKCNYQRCLEEENYERAGYIADKIRRLESLLK